MIQSSKAKNLYRPHTWETLLEKCRGNVARATAMKNDAVANGRSRPDRCRVIVLTKLSVMGDLVVLLFGLNKIHP